MKKLFLFIKRKVYLHQDKILLITIIIISRHIGTDKAFTIEVEGLKITSKTKSLLEFLVHQFATRFHLVSAFGD